MFLPSWVQLSQTASYVKLSLCPLFLFPVTFIVRQNLERLVNSSLMVQS